jgi:hypothetical protein
VWACRPEKPHHTFVPGRLNNDDARDFIRDVLLPTYQIKALAYDPRYFDDQADELSDDDDILTIELTQSDRPMRDAWDALYERIYEGRRRGSRTTATRCSAPMSGTPPAAATRGAGGRSRRSTSVRSTRSPPS